MAGVLGDEIDVLAKARRAMPGDYLPSDDEPYMGEAQAAYFPPLPAQWKNSTSPLPYTNTPCRNK